MIVSLPTPFRGIGLLILTACHGSGPPGPAIALRASDFRYDAPARVPAGLVRLTLHNQGSEIHEAILTRFTQPAASAAAYIDSVRSGVDFPAFAMDLGGPGLTRPGDSTVVWLALEPGRYAVVCWKGDHLQRGMAHDLEVVPAAAGAAIPPHSEVEIRLVDYAFGVSRPFSRGRQVLHLRNEGSEPHEADLFRLTGTTTPQDYVRWLKAGETGVPPAEPVGGVGDLVPGREVWLEVDLPPGRYFWFCRVPAADGRPHYASGMIFEFTVS